ncbi:MAG: superoxide dismutase family protein [Clostridiales bacterium]|nr:superoxide dismutase family protein [Clostridiales bacterium]
MSDNQIRINAAYADIHGSSKYPGIRGRVIFKQLRDGVLVTVRISGLPDKTDGMGVFAFHIHAGSSCTGNSQNEFADADGHFNPRGTQHPYHAGDLPPLFAHDGYAYMSLFTGRFSVKDIIGRTVIIHLGVDDFTTQPSGNAGEMIACGQIVRG